MKVRPRPSPSVPAAQQARVQEEDGVNEGNHFPLTSPPPGRASVRLLLPLGPVAGAPPRPAAPHPQSQAPTHSSRMSTTSVRFSKTSCSVMTLGCSTCRRMLTSRSISSRHTPRRLACLCRFLMNLAAYSSPVLFSRHFFTMANWPLWGHRPTQGGYHCGYWGSDLVVTPRPQ